MSNGLDLSEFNNLPPRENLRNKYPILKDKKVILFLSRLDWKKGLDILAKAYGIITKQRKDVHLLIVGDGQESFKERVKKWFRDEGVLERVVFAGMLTGREKLEAFSGSDIFVLSSHSESFGMVIVEAMACGLPVVITNTIGIHQEITEAKAGLVVPCDVSKLSEVITQLLDDKNLAQDLGRNGQVLAGEQFDFHKTTDKMIEAYKAVLAGRI